MGHTIAEKAKLLRRVRLLKSHLAEMERGFREEASPTGILHLVAKSRSAINGLMADVLEDHLRLHVLQQERGIPAGAQASTEELIDVMHAYMGR